ncbi:MAG: indolepyruvate oxidoreductase subunit beta [Desulfarculus sp.]|nr:indolepyruvate oxidoreductase subunit beta [Desulfarculus sp.]
MKALSNDPLGIVITGVGGQGNVLMSQVLGRAFLAAGYSVTVGETYGLSQRGGAVLSQVRVSASGTLGPLIPENRADAIVSLEPLEALRVLPTYGHPGVTVITNDRPLPPLGVLAGQERYPTPEELKNTLAGLCGRLYWLPATAAASQLGNPILANLVMLGALLATGLVPLTPEQIDAALGDLFPTPKLTLNHAALRQGLALAREG